MLLIGLLDLHVPVAVLRFLRLATFALRSLVMPIPGLRFLVPSVLVRPILVRPILTWSIWVRSISRPRLLRGPCWFLPLLRHRVRMLVPMLVLSHCGHCRSQLERGTNSSHHRESLHTEPRFQPDF